MESLGDVAKFLESLDVVFDKCNLLLGVLREIIHFANLHDEVVLSLAIGKGVDLVECLCNLHRSQGSLAIQRHLKLKACR